MKEEILVAKRVAIPPRKAGISTCDEILSAVFDNIDELQSRLEKQAFQLEGDLECLYYNERGELVAIPPRKAGISTGDGLMRIFGWHSRDSWCCNPA